MNFILKKNATMKKFNHLRVHSRTKRYKSTQTFNLTQLEKEYNIISPQDWYQVTPNQFKLLQNNYGIETIPSLIDSLTKSYPTEKWNIFRFEKIFSLGDTTTRHFEFFEWLGKALGYASKEDYYQLTYSQIKEYGGGDMMGNFYENSVFNALQTVYADHIWIPWKFEQKMENSLIGWIGNKLGYKTMEDW